MTVPINQLLCPVDYSTHSADALRYAAALRSLVAGDLTVLYVRASGALPLAKTEPPQLGLRDFAASTIELGQSIRLLERDGEPVTEILDAAHALSSNLIVMGTRGLSGLQRLLLGSVTERVIRRSPVPVLVVPPRFEMQEQSISLTTVLCAVDFSESSRRAVDYAVAIAEATHARLVLAHVLEWSEEQDTQAIDSGYSLPSSEEDAIVGMNSLITDGTRLHVNPEFEVGYGPPGDELLRVAQEHAAGLIVLGIRRRNPIDLALFGSTAQRLIRDGARPVLTVRTLERG